MIIKNVLNTQNLRFNHKIPAVAPLLLSNLQTTTMNVCLSTEFKTENKLDYHFIPITSGELNFRVRAPNDAHVALTTGPTIGNPMYEVSIVIVHMTLMALCF
jgi:hypothetical protein